MLPSVIGGPGGKANDERQVLSGERGPVAEPHGKQSSARRRKVRASLVKSCAPQRPGSPLAAHRYIRGREQGGPLL